MPVWLFAQIGLVCFWLIIGIYIYYTKLWKATFPISKRYYFLFTFILLVPSLLALSSIVFGLIYILFIHKEIEFSKPILFLFIIPGSYLAVLLLYTLLRNVFSLKQEKKQNQKKQEIQEFCFNWIKQFNFIKENMYNIKVYPLDDEIEGRIKIKGLTSEEFSLLKQAETKLPDNIYLYLVLKKS
ncbi:hypothetical protein V7054_26105 [Priestia megaterium]|uniref:hypothetical protein n=1 Tax=Priestia megaterium TaxID=1404 RepID=UPI0030000805